MRRLFHGRAGMALTFLIGMLIATAATAGAASLITGKQIKNGTITKKDLAKALQRQLAKTGAKGPPGLQGPKGDAGPTGPEGPTDGAAGHEAAWVPPRTPTATPDQLAEPDQAITLTTTRPGRLMVFVQLGAAGLDCSAVFQIVGAYLDGVPIPEATDGAVIVSASAPVSLFGVTAQSVPAGEHKVSVAFDCPTGDVTNYYLGTTRAAAIVLGT